MTIESFEDPNELLAYIDHHRKVISTDFGIAKKLAQLKKRLDDQSLLEGLYAPVKSKFDLADAYLKSGKFDQIAYRQAVYPDLDKKISLNNQIKNIKKYIAEIEGEIEAITSKVGESQVIVDSFDKVVRIYSIVTVEQIDQDKSFLLVPQAIRASCYSHEYKLVSVESRLGKAVLHQEVGTSLRILGSDSPAETLTVVKTEIASKETLDAISRSQYEAVNLPQNHTRKPHTNVERPWNGNNSRYQKGG